jgi:hypothetical protein
VTDVICSKRLNSRGRPAGKPHVWSIGGPCIYCGALKPADAINKELPDPAELEATFEESLPVLAPVVPPEVAHEDAWSDKPMTDAYAERDAGMARVDEATHESWKTDADDFIEAYLVQHRTLFVDDLWTSGLAAPPSPRALGPRIRAAALAGKMRKATAEDVRVGRVEEVTRPSVHSRGGHKPVWLSLIFDADDETHPAAEEIFR